jgi:hypothetical protein
VDKIDKKWEEIYKKWKRYLKMYPEMHEGHFSRLEGLQSCKIEGFKATRIQELEKIYRKWEETYKKLK